MRVRLSSSIAAFTVYVSNSPVYRLPFTVYPTPPGDPMTNTPTFKMTLTPDGTALHAYTWAQPDGSWRAWSPHALRILRKPYRHSKTLGKSCGNKPSS